jgi:excisionase family DNA binding protein
MPEKLLTIREVAEYLKLSEDEVKRLVDIGEIPAYRIGDTFLRFRKEQIDAIRSEVNEIEEKEPERAVIPTDLHGHPTHPYSDLERDIKQREPVTRQYDYAFGERLADFFYFNDFYLFSFLIIAALLYLIFRT